MHTLVGKKAPDFEEKAVVGDRIFENFSISNFLGSYVIFFFYPLDFTFVCPTELHAFQDALEAFESRGAKVIGCSVDSIYSHYNWLATPKSKGGIAGVKYPLVSDINKKIAASYGVLADEGVAYRSLVLIDKEGIIRHQVINDLPLGRSVHEALRILDALIFHEEHGEVCPANWQSGDKTMKPNQKGLLEYFT